MESLILFVMLLLMCIIIDAVAYVNGNRTYLDLIDKIYARYFKINGHDHMGQFMFVYTRILFLVVLNLPIPTIYTIIFNVIT